MCWCVWWEDEEWEWGEVGGWMPLPTWPKRYYDPASLVLQRAVFTKKVLIVFDKVGDFICIIAASGFEIMDFSPTKA